MTGCAGPAPFPYLDQLPASWMTFGGRPSDVRWQAAWIWDDGPASPRNVHLCARRDFEHDSVDGPLRLHITADARYRLYLNGEWIGDGPARSFYWAQQFDTYDLTGLLHPGRNTLDVLVSHYGEGTFQYNPSGQAGLLVQLERQTAAGWQTILVSDGEWRVARHEGYVRPTMRISCQMPFEEIVDARRFPMDWMQPGSTLPGAGPARVVARAGEGPWKHLVARSVPFLTREPISAVRLFRRQCVRLANFHTGFTARPYLLPGYYLQADRPLRGFAAAVLRSPAEQQIALYTLSERYEEPWVNGVRAETGQPVALQAGDNLLLVPFKTHNHHEYDRCYAGQVDRPVELIGLWGSPTPWSVFGPFDDWADRYEQVCRARSADDLLPLQSFRQEVREEDTLRHGSPFDESTAAITVPGTFAVEELDGLFGSGGAATVIHPATQGDPELFLDFGRELVGYLELELDAPAGTVLTFNFLEEIEDGVRIHYTTGNQNALRYITAAGRQRFTSFLRRGYRYAKLIVSDMTAPVRIRGLRTLMSTHPANERGAFRCSDPLLNDIWEIGRHTLRCCSEDTFTDCPAYEQAFWVGDARNEALINYAAYGDLALTRRCAELPALSLARQRIVESQVPSAWDNRLTAWWLLWILAVEEHYQFSGDRAYLEGIYPAVRLSLRQGLSDHTDQLGLLSIAAWNLFDWAGQDIAPKLVTHNQMFLVEALRRTIAMAEVLGERADLAEFTDRRDRLITAINTHLWDERRGAYSDAIRDDGTPSPIVSQQTNALAVGYGVAIGGRADRLAGWLTDPPEGVVRVGSPFALFYILEAMASTQQHAAILAVVRQRWGEMVRLGASSFWEMFPGWWPGWWTRSYCHAWSAAPTYFLSRYQLGAWPATPGGAVVRIAPQPIDLSWAAGTLPLPAGEVRVAWEARPDGFRLEVTLPAGSAGQVELPVSAAAMPRCKAGELEPRIVQDRWCVDLPAGWTGTIVAGQADVKEPD